MRRSSKPAIGPTPTRPSACWSCGAPEAPSCPAPTSNSLPGFSTREDALAYERRIDAVIDRLERVRSRTIAQIQGAAAGGGWSSPSAATSASHAGVALRHSRGADARQLPVGGELCAARRSPRTGAGEGSPCSPAAWSPPKRRARSASSPAWSTPPQSTTPSRDLAAPSQRNAPLTIHATKEARETHPGCTASPGGRDRRPDDDVLRQRRFQGRRSPRFWASGRRSSSATE